MMAQPGTRQDRLFDQRGHNFFQIDNAFIDVYGPRVGAYGIAVYAILIRHAGGAGDAWPGRKRIAKLAGCSPSTVDRAVLHLASEGLLTKEARVSENHGQESNLYTLNRVNVDGSPETTPLFPETTPPSPVGIAPLFPETTKEDTSNKTQLEQVPVGAGATAAPAAVASLPTGPDARDGEPKTGKPRAPRKPKAPSAPNPLAEMIAQDLTGRPTIQSRDRGLLYPVYDDIRALVGVDPVPGVMVWLSFRESLESKGKWANVKTHNARNEFGRWAANGGAPTIAGIKAEFGGGAA